MEQPVSDPITTLRMAGYDPVAFICNEIEIIKDLAASELYPVMNIIVTYHYPHQIQLYPDGVEITIDDHGNLNHVLLTNAIDAWIVTTFPNLQTYGLYLRRTPNQSRIIIRGTPELVYYFDKYVTEFTNYFDTIDPPPLDTRPLLDVFNEAACRNSTIDQAVSFLNELGYDYETFLNGVLEREIEGFEV